MIEVSPMLKQILVVTGAAVSLSACSLFSDSAEESHAQTGYFEPKSLADQDPYWKRFYELESEIAQLRAQLDSRRSESEAVDSATAAGQAESSDRHSPQNQVSVADTFLEKVRKQANDALAVIDSALAGIDEHPEATYATVQSSEQVAVAGSLQRDYDGQVVQQTNYTQSRQPVYNYSLVYVFPEPQPWDEMWVRLEEANEQDKWRGSKPAKSSYFIYVGAYLYEDDAVDRQNALNLAMGEVPEIRVNGQATSLAAK